MSALSRWRGLAAVASLLAASSASAFGQQEKVAPPAPANEDRLERGEGVIVSVEPVGGDKDDEKSSNDKVRRVKITVNTDAVWRDFVRDQASATGRADPKKAAEKGKNSVATQGQPVSSDSVIVAEVGPATRVHMRYRSSTDETNKGSRTISGAEKKDGSPASEDVKRSPRDERAPRIGVSDIKAGQFVEIEARKGRASSLIVLKPVGGADTPASETVPEKK